MLSSPADFSEKISIYHSAFFLKLNKIRHNKQPQQKQLASPVSPFNHSNSKVQQPRQLRHFQNGQLFSLFMLSSLQSQKLIDFENHSQFRWGIKVGGLNVLRF